MKWEIGKVYKTRGGSEKRVICVDRPSTVGLTLLVLPLGYSNPTVEYYMADGRMRVYEKPNSLSTLINPDEPTDEEREKIAKIFDSLHMNTSARKVREGTTGCSYITRTSFNKILEILREGR